MTRGLSRAAPGGILLALGVLFPVAAAAQIGGAAISGTILLAGVFVEDTFRVTPDLTLTLGARWDYDSVTNTPVSHGDWNNLAPRVGVSWIPGGSSRHQIRGGYGIFYERIPFAVFSDTIFNSPDGGAVSVTFAPGTAFAPPPFPDVLRRDAVDTLPLSQLPPRNVQTFDPNLRSPWTEQVSGGYVLSLTSDVATSIFGRWTAVRQTKSGATASTTVATSWRSTELSACRPPSTSRRSSFCRAASL